MDLYRKVVVIMQGGGEFEGALAKRFAREQATVILCDTDQEMLRKNAREAGTSVISIRMTHRQRQIEAVEKVFAQYNRVDVLVFPRPLVLESNPCWTEKESNHFWHTLVIHQMRVINYLLPRMIAKGGGYFVLPVPPGDLLKEFMLPEFNLLKHESYYVAEKLAEKCWIDGIRVSVMESGQVQNELQEYSNVEKTDSYLLSEVVIDSILKERFFIKLPAMLKSMAQKSMI